MSRLLRAFALLPLVLLAGAPAEDKPPAGKPAFVFREAGDEAGLFPHVAGIQGHGAAWGDVDGDGWIDLYVGTFHQAGPKPNLFFRNDKGKFRLDKQGRTRHFDWWEAGDTSWVDYRIYVFDGDAFYWGTNLDGQTRPASLEEAKWVFRCERDEVRQ